jgi:hypothetical protein
MSNKYHSVGCPKCQSAVGQHCIVLKPNKLKKEQAAKHGRVMLATATHKDRKDLYKQIHGKTFVPTVIATPQIHCDGARVTHVGNEILSGTDRLNKIIGRT